MISPQACGAPARRPCPPRRARTSLLTLVCVTLFVSRPPTELSAQSPPRVDFAKDVMPLFRQNCLECHGPKKQKNSLRLDRKSSALKSFSRRIVPGSSDNSMVYHRLIGEEYGSQMPP